VLARLARGHQHAGDRRAPLAFWVLDGTGTAGSIASLVAGLALIGLGVLRGVIRIGTGSGVR
jgi:hypothetical protein